MRVLSVIDSLIYGGTERSMLELTPPLLARGIDLEIAYLFERPGLREQLEATGVRLHPPGTAGGRAARIGALRDLVRLRRPDVVHTSLFEANLAGRVAARLQGVPVVSSLTGEPYGPEQLDDPALRRWRVRAAQLADAATARAVTRFHAVSEHVATVMSRRLRVPRERIEVIPRGRDGARLGPATPDRRARARTALGIPADARVVLAAARHEYQKGLDLLIEGFERAAPELPGARLLVAGREGNQTPRLRAQLAASSLNGNAKLLGRRDDTPDLLCAADVFVLPSRWEGFPGVVIEAMALGTPIVAADVPGAREALASDDTALFFPAGDARALAASLVRSLHDGAGSAARARAARDRFTRCYTIDRVADRTVEFYERILRNGRRPR